MREAILDWSELYERLARQAERPDATAWGELEARVRAWATPRAFGLGREEADEVADETCAEVWRTLNLARGGAAFEGFVQGRFLEVARRRPPPPPPFALAQARGDSSADERLGACLAELASRNPLHHRALSLLYEDRATVDEAADALGVDGWTVRSMAARARAALAHCLERAERRGQPGSDGNGGGRTGGRQGRSGGRPAGPGGRSGRHGKGRPRR